MHDLSYANPRGVCACARTAPSRRGTRPANGVTSTATGLRERRRHVVALKNQPTNILKKILQPILFIIVALGIAAFVWEKVRPDAATTPVATPEATATAPIAEATTETAGVGERTLLQATYRLIHGSEQQGSDSRAQEHEQPWGCRSEA